MTQNETIFTANIKLQSISLKFPSTTDDESVHSCMSGADLEGGRSRHVPPLFFCRDRMPDFVWAPQAKRMHHIVRIDFENYNFSLLLRGHIPLRHPVPTCTEVLSVLNLGAPSFKKSWIGPCMWFRCIVFCFVPFPFKHLPPSLFSLTNTPLYLTCTWMKASDSMCFLAYYTPFSIAE